ncbi:hypothetical protein CC86DRAFT_161648 [Ophiobolus disseminans]|uniref:Uncharacterized protein n=1 Tax=Ophiobolus disseminans TaxID=1469910 RepID=A0A6A7ACY2_9PLEO|nr:hypothetical protein CC86DRAFT_161648 [Ophiobolus disseminans]
MAEGTQWWSRACYTAMPDSMDSNTHCTLSVHIHSISSSSKLKSQNRVPSTFHLPKSHLHSTHSSSHPHPTMYYPPLQPQLETPLAPPGGRFPPRNTLAEPPERNTCKQHPDSRLSEQEIHKGYTRCSLCQGREKALVSAMGPSLEPRQKRKTPIVKTIMTKLRAMF